MSTKKKIEGRLKEIDWHDIPVERIAFITEDNSTCFEVYFFLFDDEANEYEGWVMKFVDILELKSDKIELNVQSDLEIYEFEHKLTEHFECKIGFLLGWNEASCRINIKCQEIVIHKSG